MEAGQSCPQLPRVCFFLLFRPRSDPPQPPPFSHHSPPRMLGLASIGAALCLQGLARAEIARLGARWAERRMRAGAASLDDALASVDRECGRSSCDRGHGGGGGVGGRHGGGHRPHHGRASQAGSHAGGDGRSRGGGPGRSRRGSMSIDRVGGGQRGGGGHKRRASVGDFQRGHMRWESVDDSRRGHLRRSSMDPGGRPNANSGRLGPRASLNVAVVAAVGRSPSALRPQDLERGGSEASDEGARLLLSPN